MARERSTRLGELEQRFAELETKLQDSPEKQALSILHAIIIESRRQMPAVAAGAPGTAGNGNGRTNMTLEDIAQLYKSAPGMEGAAENEGLPVGSEAPDFTLPDANNQPVSLHDFRGQPVVLVFYPLDWSPACSDQLSLYQSEMEDFERYQARVLAISVDSIYSHGAWSAVRGLSFPLLADFNPKGEVARRYHVYRNSDGFAERALYVVDRGGIIRYCTVSPQLHQVPDIYELFDHLKSLNGQA